MRPIAICFILTILFSFTSCKVEKVKQKPNFIVILVDDLGFGDIGAYRNLYQGGDEKSVSYLHTPELDKLAHGGIICTRAYTSSWCAPSRQMLLSGTWINRKSAVDHEFPWIGRRLRQEGYTTAMFGKAHGEYDITRNTRYLDERLTEFDQGLFFRGGMRGYYLKKGDVFPGHFFEKDAPYRVKGNEYITDLFTDRASDFIKHNSDKPFFLYLAYTAPHLPMHAKPQDLKSMFPKVFETFADSTIQSMSEKQTPPPGISAENWRKYHYAAMVYSVDRGLGKIRQVLNEAGIADNTVIVFTSDNGSNHGSNYPLTGHKWDVYEGGIRVPFIVWSDEISNGKSKGSVYDGLVTTADVAPTLMALAGKSEAEAFDGNNIMPYITGSETPRPENQIFYYREPLGHWQVTGAESLYPEKKQGIMLEAFIQKDRKYLHFLGLTDQKVYESGMALPDVRDITDPDKKLSEDIQGSSLGDLTVLTEEEFAKIKKSRDDFMEENKSDFTYRWSGKTKHENLKHVPKFKK